MSVKDRIRRLEKANVSDHAVILTLSGDRHKIICPGHPLDGRHVNTTEMQRFKDQYTGQIHNIIDDV